MDGVPGLTQPPIRPGESFSYEFTPPDAGTFWHHPHADKLQQLGRGLAGALIVEEREPVAIDRDLLWFIEDWRLDDVGRIAPGFGNRMEAGMSGRILISHRRCRTYNCESARLRSAPASKDRAAMCEVVHTSKRNSLVDRTDSAPGTIRATTYVLGVGLGLCFGA